MQEKFKKKRKRNNKSQLIYYILFAHYCMLNILSYTFIFFLFFFFKPLNSTCGDRPRIIGWLGPGPVREPFCPRRRRSPESLLRPTGAKRTLPRSNSSLDVLESRSKVHHSYCSPPSKHVKRKESQNIPAKAVTTTLNAPQLLSWPH